MQFKFRATLLLLTAAFGVVMVAAYSWIEHRLHHHTWHSFLSLMVGNIFGFISIHAFTTRSSKLLIIDDEGITFTSGEDRYTTRARDIVLIRSIPSIWLPQIEIATTNGRSTFITCYFYCSNEKFLDGCRSAGLPCE